MIINGREPQEETVAKAEEENISILITKMSAFELSGKLYDLIFSGTKNDAEGI